MGNPLGSLAKEICQNSLDEVQNDKEPVEVHFSTFDLPVNEYLDGIKKMFADQHRYWDEQQKNDRMVPDFFKHAISLLDKGHIRCLRISDFNTTGLTDSDTMDSGKWNHLIKSSGVSDKEGAKLGSYGIGKYATFANSGFRMVFYSTIDVDEKEAFQGVARLSSFRDIEGRLFDGLGYYSAGDNYSPIKQWRTLDPDYKRQTPGTDIFIVAFTGDDSWMDKITKSLLDNFLFSFLWDKLVVKINDKEISRTNIASVMQDALERNIIDTLTKDYYNALMSDNHRETTKIMEQDDIELVMKLGKDMGRRVAIVRNNGMKIFDKDRISGRTTFAGVLTLKGEKVNKFFKQLEDPTHNKWDLDRAKNRDEAEKKEQLIYSFIRRVFNTLIDEEQPDQMDAIGAGEFLPDFGGMDSKKNPTESLTDRIIKDIKVTRSKPKNQSTFEQEGSASAEPPVDEPGTSDLDGSEMVDKPGNQGTNGEGEHEEGSDSEPGNKDPFGERHLYSKKKVHDINVKFRVIKTEDGVIVTVQPKHDIAVAELELYGSGESIREPLSVVNAKFGLEHLMIKGNSVVIKNLQRDRKNRVEIGLNEDPGLSMEVSLYEVEQK
jgi:hypothetical protein